MTQPTAMEALANDAGRAVPDGLSSTTEPQEGLGPTGFDPSRVRQMQMQWSTEAGEVLFYYPSNLSAQDVEDVRALLVIALKGMDRRALGTDARGDMAVETSAAAGVGPVPEEGGQQ